MAIVGDAAATDPACSLSPHHQAFAALAESSSSSEIAYAYRGR